VATLNLSKQPSLFTQEAARRAEDERLLGWLVEHQSDFTA
jgi:hypothetical protein